MAFSVKLIETYPGFGPELTTDGNMEDDPPTNWPAGGGAAVAANTATVRNGCQSLRVTDGGAGGGYASQTIAVEAGHKYKIDVWGYSTAAGQTWRVRIYVGANVVWTSATHNVLAPVAWDKETKFYRVPNGITAIIIRLEAVAAAGVLYFDDVTVKRESPVPMTTIDLFYSATDTWAMLEKGLMPNDPERREIWGGHLEDQLVRQEDGKREIPLSLHGEWTTTDALIDSVNELEAVLRHAARKRIGGWGGEVFLEFQLHSSTYGVWYPVSSGAISKSDLMNACASIMTGGHRVTKNLIEVGVTVVCENYWESPYTYDLANLLNNPGFEEWPADICDNQPDSWTDSESLAAGTGTNDQETDTVTEGCKALRIKVVGINNGDYKGVFQNIQARLRADTQYTLLAWVQNAVITNGVMMIRAQGSVSGTLGTALNSGAANAAYTVYSCQFTPAAADIAGWVAIQAYIIGTVNGCSGIAHIDKMLVMESSNVPTGWMSSSYLMNHLDDGAGHINYLSVCDVPGEIAAESRFRIDVADNTTYLRIAKRTRDTPCDFIWELTPCDAYTQFEGGAGGACAPGLLPGGCVDSDKIFDATSPDTNRINVTFATNQNMVLRCYWDVTTNLTSYYGKFALLVIAKMEGNTDTATIKAYLRDPSNTTGGIDARAVSGTSWKLYDGWELLSFRIGTSDDDLFAAGNYMQVWLYAETDGTPTDDLHIAGAYLVALDEAYLIAGGGRTFAAGTDYAIVKCMDGDRGLFGYSTVTTRYDANLGAVGSYPLLEPEIENWLYFIGTVSSQVWTYDDAYTVSLTYRPRGIFLRGTNP